MSFNASADQFTFKLVSQNLNRFFDDKDDNNKAKTLTTKKYQHRLQQLVEKIKTVYLFADVIALQEVENKNILQDVCNLLQIKYSINYQPILIEGNDISGIDVGFLVKQKHRLESIKTLHHDKFFTYKGGPLFSRPPLLIRLCPSECLTIVNVHLRSMRGLNSSRHRKYVSRKRRLQAETLASWINNFQHQHPQEKLIMVGDFNALSPSDSYVDMLGTIKGSPDQQRPRWKSPDLIKNNLIDTTLLVNPKNRYSYKYRKRKQLLDYLLVSKNLVPEIKSIAFSRIDYKFSDHA
ncbi:MAG: endonuclease/exonuclease/phosphatase family protein, partial [Thiotrichaceae bacterium]|nr:endonuclease/exonuclease/phosphatase family protein [Thiotrichaceae bacterium]